MRKLLLAFLASLALPFFGTVGGVVLAQDASIVNKMIVSISDAITTQPEAGKWYLIKNDRGASNERGVYSPAYDAGSGNAMMRASNDDVVAAGMMAEDVAEYLLSFTESTSQTASSGVGGVYTLKWATGNYWTSSLTTTSNPGPQPQAFNVYPIETGGNQFGLNLYDMGSRVDNNGAGSSLAIWESGQVTETGGNNAWTIYEVSMRDASDEDIELIALIAEAQATYDIYDDGGFDMNIETGFSNGNGIGNGLITSTSQFSSPYTEPYEGSLSNLLDNDASTYWHSAWSSGNVDNGVHYLQVQMSDDFVGGAILVDILRRNTNNDHVTEMSVKDGSDNFIATLELPYGSQGEHVQAGFNCPEGVKTLRFYEEATTTSGDGFFHLANFQLFYTTYTETSHNEMYPTVSAALAEAIASAQTAFVSGEGMGEAITALQAALVRYNSMMETGDVESDYAVGDEVAVDGVIYTIRGGNLIPNHSFELGYTGWTDATTAANEITSDNFQLVTEGAQHGDTYLWGTTWNGSTGVGSLGTSWEIEAGKTYYFTYWIKGETEAATDASYVKTSLTNSPGTESSIIEEGSKNITMEWQQIEIPFTNTDGYSYLQVRARWLDSQFGFDNFQLYEAEATGYVAPLEDDTYVLQNVETGLYLAGYNSWGTQASLLEQPMHFALVTQSDGTYTLNSDLGTSTTLYFGINPSAPEEYAYLDQGSVNHWIITERESGNYTVRLDCTSTTAGANVYNGFYLTGGSKLFDTCPLKEDYSAAAEWRLLSTTDIKAAQAATLAGDSIDVTGLLHNAMFGTYCEGSAKTHWTITSYDGTASANNGSINESVKTFESWCSNNGFNVSQKLENLTAGTYKLSTQAFYLDYNSSGTGLPVLYAGSAEITPMDMHDAEGECTAVDDWSQNLTMARNDFLSGLYPVELKFTVGVDGEDVTIGYKGSNTTMWNTLGNMTLTYYGIGLESGTAIHECEAEESHWTSTGTGIGYNTWSTEADASGMGTPFLQLWVDSNIESLSEATVSHETLTGLPSGYYGVSIDARIFSEAGNDIETGTLFKANGESVDLLSAGSTGTYATNDHPYMTEVYGTYSLIANVTGATLDISFSIPSGVSYNWLAWKNLKVDYFGLEMPELAAAEGKMNASVEAAMTAALEVYNTDKTAENYYAAIAAIQAAEASAEYYAGITAVVENLDSYGAAVWGASSEAVAYEACELDGEDLTAVLVEAQKAQLTGGSDMSLVVVNEGSWVNDTGTYGEAVERYVGGTTVAPTDGFTEGMTLYKEITGLTPGVYTVTFYAVANSTNERDDVDAATGDGVTEAFANDATEGVTVGTDLACVPSDYPYTLTCTVGDDGTLRFGLQNVATGGNWYVCQAVSLTLVQASFDDDEYAVGDSYVAEDGTVYEVLGGNLFVNGGFNSGVDGWTAGNTYTNAADISNYDYSTAGGFNNGAYITLKSSVSASSAMTPTQAIAVEVGCTYLFIAYTSGTCPSSENMRYSALFEMASATQEANHEENGTTYSNTIVELDWGENGSTEWTQTAGVFTATTDYVGMRMNWSLGSYDGFQLYKVEASAEEDLSELIAKYAADLAEAAEVTAGLEEKIAAAKDDEGYDSTILANMEEALAGLQEVVGIYGSIDTADTTAEELTEAIEAIESALATAQDALATGLNGVTAATGSDVIYTIGGVRVSNMNKPGVYIVNGKKVMVK